MDPLPDNNAENYFGRTSRIVHESAITAINMAVDLVKYIIESDQSLVINKEFIAKAFPLCIEWSAGNDLVLEPILESAAQAKSGLDNHKRDGFQKIKITDKIIILRKGVFKKGKTDILPFLFLESVRRKEYQSARKVLGFDINDENLKQYFGEFEILVNNYLGRDDVFSILPKGSDTAKNFVFEIAAGKISGVTPLAE